MTQNLQGIVLSILSLLCLLCISTSCQKDYGDHLKTVKVYGHGGMGNNSIHRMNSSTSINKAYNLDIDGCEIDVQITKDSQLVAYHGLIKGDYISNYESAELDDKILLVKDLIAKYPSSFSWTLDIEYQGDHIDKAFKYRFLNQLIQLEENFIDYNINIELSDTHLMGKFIDSLTSPIHFVSKNINMIDETVIKYDIDGISSHVDSLGEDDIIHYQDIGLEVVLWSVSSAKDNDRAILLAPNIIQSDCLRDLINKLN